MTPRSEALAFRIWAYCEPRGWDVTAAEIGQHVGAGKLLVGRVLAAKGWSNRVRADSPRYHAAADRTAERLDFAGRELAHLRRELSDLANYS